MQDQPFSVGEAFSEGWRLTKKHLGFLIAYQIIMWLLIVLFSGAPHSFGTALWHILGNVVFIVVDIGLYKSNLMIRDGVKPGYDQLYRNWRLFLSWIVAGFLFGLMFLIGFVMLIIPGCYVWARYGLYPFFIVDKGAGPLEALELAAKASEGSRWQLFWLFLACLALNIAGLLVFVVGLLITVPITLLAMATAYRALVYRPE